MKSYKSLRASCQKEATYPHMMYHPDTGEEVKVANEKEHEKYAKLGYGHDKPMKEEALNEITDKFTFSTLASAAKAEKAAAKHNLKTDSRIKGKNNYELTVTGKFADMEKWAKSQGIIESADTEEVDQIDEGRNESLKALEMLVKKGGIDKADFQKAHDLYKAAKLNDLKKHIKKLDTDVAEAIADIIQRHDSRSFNSMYPRAKSGDHLANIVQENKNHPKYKDAKKQHKAGVWDGNVDKDGNPIVHINGKPVVVESNQTERLSFKSWNDSEL